MKHSVLYLFFLLTCHMGGYAAVATDSIVKVLDEAVRNKQQYVTQKEQRIAAFRQNFSRVNEYEFNKALYEEYRRFSLDSAVACVLRNQQLAAVSGSRQQQDEAAIQLAELYSSLGKYLESETLLKAVDKSHLTPGLLPAYYEACIRFYEHYLAVSYNEVNLRRIELYRDSLLAVTDPRSPEHILMLAAGEINRKQVVAAEKQLLELLPAVPETHYAYAMAAYLLGNINKARKNTALQKYYYTLSAIADTRAAVKDQASISNLALLYYHEGDIERAYLYTRSAIEDAVFCKVQFRTSRLAEFFSLINTAYQEKETARRRQLQGLLVSVSLLSVFLVVAVVYVYRQMKKVSAMREALYVSSEQLAALNREISHTNAQLRGTNMRLSESNHIKEEYIAHFFDLCSAYISKLENYRKTLNQKATGKKLDELFELLRSTSLVDNELEELYRNFDHIFLNLYPSFVKDFNALLVPEEQVVLKQGELLNTELRIFALIRLGITDSVKIAAFLRYSLSTIYNYRTKARNKAAVSRDAFENRVMEIGLPVQEAL